MAELVLKFTGKTFTPKEFRELNQCTLCGKAEKIGYGERCNECFFLEVKNCSICSVVLRKGLYRFYSYDITENLRRNGVEFKPNKNYVKEFVEREEYDNIFSENLCVDCKDWETDMRNDCDRCGKLFMNHKDHYIENANTCGDCVDEMFKGTVFEGLSLAIV